MINRTAVTRQTSSTHVVSRQISPSKRLSRILQRYLDSEYSPVVPDYAYTSFHKVETFIQNHNRPIILDSGCGTGESTLKLARLHPDCSVIGIDKSLYRLQRIQALGQLPENLLLVRCNVIYLWYLLEQSPWRLKRHYLLFPNPWPKPEHIKRRWHAHPILPVLLQLGGVLTMRTNWRVYADEFALALQILLQQPVLSHQLMQNSTLSPFERKYRKSDHEIFEVEVSLSNDQQALRLTPPAIQL